MFEDFVKNNAMEDAIKPSKKRINANCSALMSLIEQEEHMSNNRKSIKVFKKPAVIAAAAVCVSLAGVTAFAANTGLFTSIKNAFYGSENALRASEPSEYAFIPEADSIIGDGVTVNITEAVADSHGIRVFMDMVFENGIPQKVHDNSDYNYASLRFESCDTQMRAGYYTRCVSVEDNVLSLYVNADGIQENEWKNDGFTIEIENFGFRTESGDFETISDISGIVTIPPEQIKRNDSLTAYSDIDGAAAEMEISLLGINITFDSKEDYDKTEAKISRRGIITPSELCIYMKDGTVYGSGENMGKAMDILGGGSGGTDSDGKYYRYIRFNMPVDIEKIEKITLGGYEFCF